MNIYRNQLRSVVFASAVSIVATSACVTTNRMPRETDLGSHHVSVTPNCQSTSTNSLRNYESNGSSRLVFYEFQCGETKVRIERDKLTVNGKSYGSLNEGDRIVVNYGDVRVNSTARAAQ